MQKTLSSLAVTMAAMSFTTLVPASLPAQSIWLDRRHDKAIDLEVLIPDFKNDDGGTITRSNSGLVIFSSLRLPLSEKVHFVGELPFAHGRSEIKSSRFNLDESTSESAIGNPYLGLEMRGQNPAFFGEIGVRLPLASEDDDLSMSTGLFTDVDRLEAFFPKILSITGMANVHHVDKSGFAIRLRGGPSLLINTDKDEFEDASELFIGYSAQLGYESEPVSVIGGFTGRASLTEEDVDYSERSVHQLGFAASFGLGTVRPGVHLRLPVDEDMKDTMDFVLGFHLGVRLN